MADRFIVYNIIYALAAQGGREKSLFGSQSRLALAAFEQGLVGMAFPELWFELPLLGDPWFDLHMLVAREDLGGQTEFAADEASGNPEVMEWFAAQERGVRQLALSYDVSSGDIGNPAVQLLVDTNEADVTCDFLTAAGRPDMVPAYRSFSGRLPEGWFACYTGVFPGRSKNGPGLVGAAEPAKRWIRVECIPSKRLQLAYARDARLLENDLRHVGLRDLDDELLRRCQVFAQSPFQLEFQFNVNASGLADQTLGASVRFDDAGNAQPDGAQAFFQSDGSEGELMRQVQEWGLCDDRWRLLEDTVFAKSLSRGAEQHLIYCYPAFVKLRWRDGKPLDAKTYLKAGISDSRNGEDGK